jgi:hypothetical protein
MKRTLTITWTSSEDVTIDIPDYTLTADEISALIEEKASDIIHGGRDNCDEWNYEFQEGTQPKELGEGNIPPPSSWMTIGGFTVATNGYAITVQGSPVEMANHSAWRNLKGETKNNIERLEKMLSVDTSKLPPHTGWFADYFKNFEGFRVVGNAPQSGISTDCGGYVLDESGCIIAVLMPSVKIHDFTKVFQFNK